MPSDLNEQLAAAIAAERAAWLRVKDKLPGTAAYDDALWQAWRAAGQRCRDARKALDDAAGPGTRRSGGSRASGKPA